MKGDIRRGPHRDLRSRVTPPAIKPEQQSVVHQPVPPTVPVEPVAVPVPLEPEPPRVIPTPRQRRSLPRFSLPRVPRLGVSRRLITTAVALTAVVGIAQHAVSAGSHLQNEVPGSVKVAEQAVTNAKSSLKRGDALGAQTQFQIAEQALGQANVALRQRGQATAVTTQASGAISAGTQLLSEGELVMRSANVLVGELAVMQQELLAKQGDLYQSGTPIVEHLPALQRDLDDLEERLQTFRSVMANAKRAMPPGNLRQAVVELEASIKPLDAQFQQTREVLAVLPALLGADQTRQYLLVLQNPAELRPNGGFMGTLTQMKVHRGAIKTLEVDSVYTIANQANPLIEEEAPEPIKRFFTYLNEDGSYGEHTPFHLQNANWFADWPTSAQRIQKYYEKGGGQTSDVVVAITLNPFLDILKLLGPVELPQYGYVLNANNFAATIHADQETRAAAGDTDPKKILRDMLPVLVARINAAPLDQKQRIVEILENAGRTRDIQAYSPDDRVQALFREMNVDGGLLHEQNSLLISDANLLGFKTSAVVTTSLHQTIRLDRDGRAEVTLDVTRNYQHPTTQRPNRNYTRIYVPKGSQVTRKEGWLEDQPVTVADDEGSTVVAGWNDVATGAVTKYRVVYRPPGVFKGELPVLIQKQPGTAVAYYLDAELPDGFVWQDQPADITVDGATAKYRTIVNQNVRLALPFRRR